MRDEAPSAIRTPISRRRCSTRYDSTLNNPDTVNNSARPPSASETENAIRKKNELWFETNDIHSVDADGPFVGHGDEFAMHYTWDVTPKQTGTRMKISEMALYKVQDGKIAREQFFYHMPGK